MLWPLALLIRGPVPTWGLSFMTSSTPSYLPKAPLLNTITMGIKASIYELEVGGHKYLALSKEKGFWCFASLAPLTILSLSTSCVML